MAVVFQEPLLFNTSVYNNIIMGLKFRKIRYEVNERLEYFTEKLKIGRYSEKEHKKPFRRGKAEGVPGKST